MQSEENVPPLVSVIMPVYNTEKYLSEAIDSLLSQTFSDFDLLIFDDASTDKSKEIILKYEAIDKRIKPFFSQVNQGLTFQLNEGIRLARGKYIARMDSDDIALPFRLEKQVEFLESNPTTGVVGTAIFIKDESLTSTIEESFFPDTHGKLLWTLLFKTSFSHPTILMRSCVCREVGGYSLETKHVEDYDLFLRLKNKTGLANLRDTLLVYRRHDNSVNHKFSDVQRVNSFNLSKKYIHEFNLEHYCDEALMFLKSGKIPKENIKRVSYFLWELYHAFLFKNKVTDRDRIYIYRDMVIKQSILSITHLHTSFIEGLIMYLRLVFKAPWIILHNIKSRQ